MGSYQDVSSSRFADARASLFPALFLVVRRPSSKAMLRQREPQAVSWSTSSCRTEVAGCRLQVTGCREQRERDDRYAGVRAFLYGLGVRERMCCFLCVAGEWHRESREVGGRRGERERSGSKDKPRKGDG